MPTSSLSFQNTHFEIIEQSNQLWLTATDIAKALGYRKRDAVTQIFERNSDEFTGQMTETLRMSASGNYQKTVRIFSLRGAHLIAMFSRTSAAKEFRKWVLDVLDREIQKPQNNQNPTLLNNAKRACERVSQRENQSYNELLSLKETFAQIEHSSRIAQNQINDLITSHHSKRDHIAHIYLAHQVMVV
ncbi:BRO-N domain-containing protein [Vibrio bathopelagicus]|uniref:BRO-N domain-containing protein n=1 Tax=Vibrio bathopelagicus TaxID=2777577 RepID=UPI001864322B|nr:BRO family protein [Vibrio bathopelagicus]